MSIMRFVSVFLQGGTSLQSKPGPQQHLPILLRSESFVFLRVAGPGAVFVHMHACAAGCACLLLKRASRCGGAERPRTRGSHNVLAKFANAAELRFVEHGTQRCRQLSHGHASCCSGTVAATQVLS